MKMNRPSKIILKSLNFNCLGSFSLKNYASLVKNERYSGHLCSVKNNLFHTQIGQAKSSNFLSRSRIGFNRTTDK